MVTRLCAMVAVCLVPALAQAATITVCASGCTYNNAQLQTAINAAACGDEILLQKGHTYVGRFILRAQSCSVGVYTTLRTGVTSTGSLTPSSDYPAANIRITSSSLSNLATLQAPSANEPALHTVEPGYTTGGQCSAAPCIAHDWQIKWLAFTSEAGGYNGLNLIELGSYRNAAGLLDGGSNTQNLKSEIPSDIIVDQIYVYGHAIRGQHRGLAIAARNVVVKNSYFKDLKTHDHDGQAVWCNNTDGPITLTNNRIEGSTENFMCGGDDSRIVTNTTVSASPTPTTTQFAVASTSDLDTDINKWISVVASSTTYVTQVTNISGSTLTVSPALPSAPSSGNAVKWTVNPKDVTIEYNDFYKPPEWRDPIVSTPTSVTATPTTGGSLGAGTYYYKVVSRHPVNRGNTARSTASSEVSCTISGANSACLIQWAENSNVTSVSGDYYIYGRASAAQNVRFSSTSCSGGTCSFTDTGAAGTSENVPTTTGTVWSVKNNFELKNCVRCTIRYNRFRYSWTSGQSGDIILLSSMNQDGGDPSAVVMDVTFSYNKISHGPNPINISAIDTTGQLSGTAQRITISHNLWTDVGTAWGDARYTFQITEGEASGLLARNPEDLVWDHNTVICSGGCNGPILFDLHKSGAQRTAVNFKFRNSIDRRGVNGLRALTPDFDTEGTVSWDKATSGASRAWTKNGVEGITCANYPDSANNFCVDLTTWQAQFVDYAGGDYRLAGSSTWNNAGTDGLDLGADIDTINTAMAIAESGNNSGSSDRKYRLRMRIR